jgi:hypothetical protein
MLTSERRDEEQVDDAAPPTVVSGRSARGRTTTGTPTDTGPVVRAQS